MEAGEGGEGGEGEGEMVEARREEEESGGAEAERHADGGDSATSPRDLSEQSVFVFSVFVRENAWDLSIEVPSRGWDKGSLKRSSMDGQVCESR